MLYSHISLLYCDFFFPDDVLCLLFYWSFVLFHLTSHYMRERQLCVGCGCVWVSVCVCTSRCTFLVEHVLIICVVCCDVSICFYIYVCVCVYACQPAVEISRLQHLCRLLLHRKWIAVVGLPASKTICHMNPPLFCQLYILSAFLEFRESFLFYHDAFLKLK